jgi:hypothetical protein
MRKLNFINLKGAINWLNGMKSMQKSLKDGKDLLSKKKKEF